MIICYNVPEIWCMTDVIVIFDFGLFFPFYFPSSLKNKNYTKMKKTPGDIIILHMCTKNYDYMMYGSWDMVRDRWTDWQTEKVTQRWVPHLKMEDDKFAIINQKVNQHLWWQLSIADVNLADCLSLHWKYPLYLSIV